MEGEGLFVQERPTVGLVLRDAFALFSSHMPQFLSIAALTMAPLAVIAFAVAVAGVLTGIMRADVTNVPLAFAFVAFLVLLFVIGAQLVSAAFTYGVFQIERGRPLRIGDCFAIGLRRLPMVVLIGIVVGILTFVGLLLCVVPGVLIAIALSMAVPAAVVERVSFRAALERSQELTSGFRGLIFGVFAVLYVISNAVSLLFQFLGLANQALSIVLLLVFSVVVAGVQATALAVLYYRLRAAKGALDVDEIAAVFE